METRKSGADSLVGGRRSPRRKVDRGEVKSSGYNAHKSLDAFCKKYSSRVLWKYLIYTKDLAKDGDTLLVPAYMTAFL